MLRPGGFASGTVGGEAHPAFAAAVACLARLLDASGHWHTRTPSRAIHLAISQAHVLLGHLRGGAATWAGP